INLMEKGRVAPLRSTQLSLVADGDAVSCGVSVAGIASRSTTTSGVLVRTCVPRNSQLAVEVHHTDVVVVVDSRSAGVLRGDGVLRVLTSVADRTATVTTAH